MDQLVDSAGVLLPEAHPAGCKAQRLRGAIERLTVSQLKVFVNGLLLRQLVGYPILCGKMITSRTSISKKNIVENKYSTIYE